MRIGRFVVFSEVNHTRNLGTDAVTTTGPRSSPIAGARFREAQAQVNRASTLQRARANLGNVIRADPATKAFVSKMTREGAPLASGFLLMCRM